MKFALSIIHSMMDVLVGFIGPLNSLWTARYDQLY